MKENILIALSDEDLVKALHEDLKQNGFFVDTVSDGNDVLNKLRTTKPDLLLIDTVLPNKSGYDILNEKSFDKDITKIPVIIISNSGDALQMKQIPSTPVIRDYIVKVHIDPVEVVEKIEKVFGRATPTPVTTTVTTPNSKGKKVLWAEDDRLLGTILTRKFDASGYTLLRANDGQQALKFLETETPDVIILDIMMPGITGMELLETLKKNDRVNKVPVIMLSNLNKQSDVEKARSLGANRFLVKATVSLDEIIKEAGAMMKHT
jgi:DNA-binding response OmpR family regulator